MKLPDGRALTGQSHDYKRHGTTTLFAALNVASCEVGAITEREIHVVLDNLSTHRPARDTWLKRSVRSKSGSRF